MRGNIPFLKQNRYTLQKNKCKILLQRKRSWKFLWEDRCKYKIEYHFKGRIHKGCYKYLKKFTNSKFLQDFVQISSKFFYKTIVLALQKMYLLLSCLTYIIYPLKSRNIMPWYAYQFEGIETWFILPFYIEFNLEYTTGIIEL